MSATDILADHPNVSFVETDANTWTVTIDGVDTRTITRDGTQFIVWIGSQHREWSFSRALKCAIEHSRFRRDQDAKELARGEKARAEYFTWIDGLSPQQITRQIENDEAEFAYLSRGLARYNHDREDMLKRRIADLKAALAREAA